MPPCGATIVPSEPWEHSLSRATLLTSPLRLPTAEPQAGRLAPRPRSSVFLCPFKGIVMLAARIRRLPRLGDTDGAWPLEDSAADRNCM